MRNPFRYFNSSPAVIRTAVLLYIRFPLSLRQVENLLHERGIDVSHETVRFWWNRFGPVFAAEFRKKQQKIARQNIQWRWHLDEVFVRVNGERRYLWRAVDHEGEALEVHVTRTRDRRAALVFLKRALKRFGSPRTIVTDRLRSYRAALSELGAGSRRDTARWLNNRAENSHQPFRRRERSMQRFRSPGMLQKFVSTHTAIYSHFDLDRHLSRRPDFKQRRDSALADWRQLAA
ncbi:MAG: IS6 family transposase [Parvibaculum sp.]